MFRFSINPSAGTPVNLQKYFLRQTPRAGKREV